MFKHLTQYPVNQLEQAQAHKEVSLPLSDYLQEYSESDKNKRRGC